jgi:predicted nuclease of predicted toxin-antitoxin system
MKILIDMNLSPKFADLLMNKGLHAEHWIEIGAPNAEDTEIMEYALKNNYTIMTCDLDFNIILSITHSLKPSVVQLRTHRIRVEQDGEWIASAIIQSEKNSEFENSFPYVEEVYRMILELEK